jgi:hypothetical protein
MDHEWPDSTISFFTSRHLYSDILRKYHQNLLNMAFVETVSKVRIFVESTPSHSRPLFCIIPFDGFNLVKLQPIPSTTSLTLTVCICCIRFLPLP